MANSITPSILFVTLDTYGARVPLFSTAMSFAHLFLKHAVMPCMKERSIHENHIFTHLSHSNSWRQVALLIPIIGNIAVWIYDKYAENQGAQLLILALNENNSDLRVTLYEKAAQFGNDTAKLFLAFHHLNVTQKTDQAVELTMSVLSGAFAPYPHCNELFHLQEAAKAGNSEAMTIVGFYEEGKTAIAMLNQAVKLGNPHAMAYLGLCCILGANEPESFKAAEMLFKHASKSRNNTIFTMVEVLKRAAKWGNNNALTALGHFYTVGLCVEQDIPKGVKFLEDAIKLQNPLAALLLGSHLIDIKSYGEGIKHLHDAARAKNTFAMCILAILYLEGKIVKKNIGEAIALAEKAESLGSIEAKVILGPLYFESSNNPEKIKKAIALFEQAAENNSLRARLYLGFCYLEGKGVDQNPEKAVALFEQNIQEIAKNTSKDTMEGQCHFCLGCCYHDGIGVAVDRTKALELFKQAIELGGERMQAEINKLGIDLTKAA